VDHSVRTGAGCGVERRFDAIIRPEPVQSERAGEQLGVGGRFEKFSCVALEEGPARVE